MDRIDKVIAKFNQKEKKWTKAIFKVLKERRFEALAIKKLQDREDIFRVRKGNIRVIYEIVDKKIVILKVSRRRESTYKF